MNLFTTLPLFEQSLRLTIMLQRKYIFMLCVLDHVQCELLSVKQATCVESGKKSQTMAAMMQIHMCVRTYLCRFAADFIQILLCNADKC